MCAERLRYISLMSLWGMEKKGQLLIYIFISCDLADLVRCGGGRVLARLPHLPLRQQGQPSVLPTPRFRCISLSAVEVRKLLCGWPI